MHGEGLSTLSSLASGVQLDGHPLLQELTPESIVDKLVVLKSSQTATS